MLKTILYDEKTLLIRVAGGDEQAFRQLFHHYNKQLYPFVVKLTRSTEAAEEVLQEVFLKVWQYRGRLADVENPKAYIVRMVTNESVDYMKAALQKRRLAERFGRLSVFEAPFSPSPEQDYAYRETEQRLREAVDRLPEGCQQVYRMSREEYKCIPEIAAELNISHSTVKNQLVKALKRIRLHMGTFFLPIILLFLTRR